uniref:F-box/kelch-repeat protein At3g06240-like n=1 Tax=Erigeron canadensis TaxID=72917 RepID=UPI001CB8FE7C|nr:F-box/kelch-repeat protein At3g06240-like [Erigeron canadensis]
MMMIESEDMITEILSRLPSKSVGRFRCVSKGWLSLLTQPEFIKTHHRKNRTNHHMFIEADKSTHRYVLYSHSFVSEDHLPLYIINPTNKLPFEFIHVQFRGSCDGLVLVSQLCYIHAYRDFMLLNPTTRESMQLPQCGYYPRNIGELRCVTNGFGYDSVADDYKVVTLAYFGHIHDDYRNQVIQTVVYSLRSNTWRHLSIDIPFYDCRFTGDAVYLNGFLLWKGKNKDNLHLIVAFSLVDESFSEVLVPNFSNDSNFMLSCCKLVVLGGKLAMFMYEKYIPLKLEVWLMNEYGVQESWTKIPLDMYDNFPEAGYRIFDDNGKIWVANNGQIWIYDSEKATFTKIVYWNSLRFDIFASYVENLFSLKRKDTTYAEQILDVSAERQNNQVALPKNLNPICHPFCNKFLRFANIFNGKKASLRKKRKAEVKDKRKKVKNSKKIHLSSGRSRPHQR